MTTEGASEADLARRAARGDRTAFGQLARTYGPKLSALVKAYGVPAADVEDVAQEAFIAAWRALADYDTSRSFKAWLYQIALNKARDWRRRRKVRAFFFNAAALDAPEAQSLEDDAARPEALASDADLQRVVRGAVAQLPDDLKSPFLLIAFAELTYAEAASALGLSQKAIEGRLKRARLLLREKLPHLDEPS